MKTETTVPLLQYDEEDLRRFIGYYTNAEPSDAVLRCLGLLASWVGGTHHIRDHMSVNRVDWTHPWHVSICFRCNVSTFDFDLLTRLVFLAHDLLIRVDLEGASTRYFRLMLSVRHKRQGEVNERHPTIEGALAKWRERHDAVAPHGGLSALVSSC